MFASYFIVKGTNSAMKPDSFVEDAAPVVDRLLPVVQHALPASISAHIPEDTKTLAVSYTHLTLPTTPYV